jgi:hypothetical protein
MVHSYVLAYHKNPVKTKTKHLGTDQHGRPFHKPVLITALRPTGTPHIHTQVPLLITERACIDTSR